MISVIIPKYDDSTNIKSCLNSIKRQTFDKIEILVINDNCDEELIKEYNLIQVKNDSEECCGLNKAIAQAKGNYIYFCSASSVMSPNTLSELMSVSSDCLAYVDVSIHNKGVFNTQEQLMSCYGKVFDKKIIDKIGLKFDGNSVISECVFVSAYMGQFKKIHKNTELYIYDSKYSPICGTGDIIPEMKYWKQCLRSINGTVPEINGIISRALSKVISEHMICSEELANEVREISPLNYVLNYACFSPVFKLTWEKAVTDNDVSAYERFKSYAIDFEDEDVLELLFEACGLKIDYYKYVKNNNISQCMFFIEESERLSSERNELTQVVKTIMSSQGSGLCKIASEWHYYSNGKLDTTFRGMVKNNQDWFYVSNGKIDYEYVGLCRKGNEWYYITDGTINSGYTGLAMNEDGVWMYITNGKTDRDFVGLIDTPSGLRYIANGVIDKDYAGLVKANDGKYIYIQNGTVNKSFIGLVQNDEGWWYVENGEINYSYNGFARNNLGWCEVEKGKAKPETILDIFKILKEEPIKEELPPDPVEVSIGYYRNGQLGLKTIIKSIGAWGKYKFKR